MSLTIVEVLERSVQGRTEPYLCRADDGKVYFVKGQSATRQGLAAEWLCACLAERFGLPVAPYCIATVPDELIEADLTGWLRDLGPGEVFASRRVAAVDLTDSHRHLVPEALRRDIVAFDWWVRNADRNLTAYGGNPNLLWNPEGEGSLVVIDHNLAFDPEFSPADFLQLHVFADDIRAMFSDYLLREAYAARFQAALGIWDEACHNVPDAWRFIDQERTLPVGFSLPAWRNLLERAATDSFWVLPT
ncbi:MAG: HipA family kinase [Azonexus sp.]